MKNAQSMLNLGLMFEKGTGVDKDYEVAMEYYIKAAQLGNGPAMEIVQFHEPKRVEAILKNEAYKEMTAMNRLPPGGGFSNQIPLGKSHRDIPMPVK